MVEIPAALDVGFLGRADPLLYLDANLSERRNGFRTPAHIAVPTDDSNRDFLERRRTNVPPRLSPPIKAFLSPASSLALEARALVN